MYGPQQPVPLIFVVKGQTVWSIWPYIPQLKTPAGSWKPGGISVRVQISLRQPTGLLPGLFSRSEAVLSGKTIPFLPKLVGLRKALLAS